MINGFIDAEYVLNKLCVLILILVNVRNNSDKSFCKTFKDSFEITTVIIIIKSAVKRSVFGSLLLRSEWNYGRGSSL